MSQNMTSKGEHRRSFFTFFSSKSQLKYALVNLYFTSCGVIIFALLCTLKISREIQQVGPSLSAEMQNWLNGFNHFLVIATVAVVIFMGIVITLYTLFFTHRFTGPLVQMTRIVEQMIRGDYTQRVKLREGDETKELAEKLNKLLDSLEGKTKNDLSETLSDPSLSRR